MRSAFRQERRRRLEQERVSIDYGDLKAIVAESEYGPLSAEQRATLEAAIDTLARVQDEVANGARIHDLRRFLGWPSEKSRRLVGRSTDEEDDRQGDGGASVEKGGASQCDGQDDGDEREPERGEQKPKKKKKEPKKRTSGRRSASSYTGATVVPIEHESLKPKDDCPDSLCTGKVYRLPEPAKILRITGTSPLNARLYLPERLRCNLCGTVYTAELPADVGNEKYDETAAAMLAVLRYGHGLPHNRLENLSENLGVPMPSSTQWDIVNRAADALMPVFDELVIQAAQGDVLTIDDTYIKVIKLNASLAEAYASVEARVKAGELPTSALKAQRTGVYTTGIVSTGARGDIVVFLTGAKHAGENFQQVLALRAADLTAPVRMADGLSRNFVGDLDTFDANCLVHGRRQFVDVLGSFPDEVEYVLDKIGEVYKEERIAKEAEMSPDERLAHHQAHSKPVMDKLHSWMRRQIDERLVEPNSGLGGAIAYLDDHWSELTLFLRVAGAPLDSNIVERALKTAICHRKNSLFYRSERGALVGDAFMSLIHTAERHGVNSFDYLVAILRHRQLATDSPADWMPWNYAATTAHHELS